MTRRYLKVPEEMPQYIRIVNETDLTPRMRSELRSLRKDIDEREENNYALTRQDQFPIDSEFK